jgi:hypothetical protein
VAALLEGVKTANLALRVLLELCALVASNHRTLAWVFVLAVVINAVLINSTN